MDLLVLTVICIYVLIHLFSNMNQDSIMIFSKNYMYGCL